MASFFQSVSDSIDYMSNYSQSHDYEALECDAALSHYKMMQFLMIPAFAMIFIYCFSIRRKLLVLNWLDGRPGIVYPMSMLSTSESLSYTACFGVISTLVIKIIFESKQAFEYQGPVWAKAFVTIVSMFIYGIDCFPLFASVCLQTAISYACGTLYTWAFTVLTIVSFTDCEMSKNAHIAYVFENLPMVASLLFLSVRLPYGFVKELKEWRRTGSFQKVTDEETVVQIRTSYQGMRVTALLKSPKFVEKKPNKSCSENVVSSLKKFLTSWIYKWEKDFRYSSRMLAIAWMGFITIYMTAYKFVWSCTSLFYYITDAANYALDGIGWDDSPGDSFEKETARILLKVYYYLMMAFWILAVICILVALVIGTISILYILTSYRKNLKALYRGDNSHVPPRSAMSNISLLEGSMRYAGYQIGYIAWALVIQTFCLFVFIILICLVVVIIFIGFSGWLASTVEFFGPFLLLFIIILVVQYLCVRYGFLQNHEESLSIDNRRVLFTFTYFLFFYNVFIGLISCLLRLIKAMLLGILLISRLDHSALPRAFELHDTGFARYVGFMHTESYHTHPCMHIFLRLLKNSCNSTKRKFVTVTDVKNTIDEKRSGNYLRNKLLNTLGGSNKVSKTNQVANSSIGDNNKDVEKGQGQTWDSGKLTADTLASRINLDISTPEPAELAGRGTTRKSSVGEGGKENVLNKEMGGAGEVKESWQTLKDSPAVQNYRKSQRAEFNWALVYTLVNNPQLCLLRKGFLQQRMKRLKTGYHSKTEEEKVEETVKVENIKVKLGVKKPTETE